MIRKRNEKKTKTNKQTKTTKAFALNMQSKKANMNN